MAERVHAREGSVRGLADPTDARSNCGAGVVMDLDGGTDHSVVADGLDLLMDLEHRGALGAEENTGDGAVAMTGWTVRDIAGHEYEFPDGFSLPSGQSASFRPPEAMRADVRRTVARYEPESYHSGTMVI